MTTPLKVLVVGGGVAGPATAYWLSRIGAEITLIERSPHMRASGQQLDLRAHGVPLMKKMGMEAAVRGVAVHETGTQLIDVHGHVKAFFPTAPTNTGKQSVTSEFEIMRADLVKILYGLTAKKSNVRHLFNTAVESFTQDDESDVAGKVHVNFQNGQKEDFDLVIGADGAGSRTRRMILGPGTPDYRYPYGGYIGFFSVPTEAGDSDRFTFCHLPGTNRSRIIGTRKDCPEVTRIYMFLKDRDPALDAAHKSGRLEDLKKAWSDIFQDGGWQCGRFMQALKSAPEADDLYSTSFDEIRLPKGLWSKGRVVLVGDAAHGHTADGFGTTMSLVGSYILAGEIATSYEKNKTSPTKAVISGAKNYEDLYRPITSSMDHSTSNQWVESLMFPRSNFGIWCLHKLTGLAAYFKVDQMFSQMGEQSKWQLPEYPALER